MAQSVVVSILYSSIASLLLLLWLPLLLLLLVVPACWQRGAIADLFHPSPFSCGDCRLFPSSIKRTASTVTDQLVDCFETINTDLKKQKTMPHVQMCRLQCL